MNSLLLAALAATSTAHAGYEWQYDKIIINNVSTQLLAAHPKDATLLCSKFASQNSTERKQFYADLFRSIAKYESGFNPRTRYLEKWGVYSEGLLQLSYGDETRHKPCAIDKSKNNIFDPEVNLTCGLTIMHNQFRKLGLIFPEKAYYWSVLTKRKYDIISYFKKISVCD